MSDVRDIREDLEPGESPEVVQLAERLLAARPVPRAAFRGDLGRRLRSRSPRMRARLRLVIAGYAASGALLLMVGAIGAAGGGPLG
jgi:hypothetical protein